MSSSQLKRVNYSIYLNPVNSLSDRYAVGIMQKWVNERKDMLDNPDAGLDLHNSLHMHKNIYLSGMFLHLLSPALSAGLATSLGDDSIKMATLKQHFDACGLAIPMASGQAPDISRQDIDAIKAAVDMTPLFNEIQSLRDDLRQASEDNLRHVSQSSQRENELLLSQQKTQQELAETRQTLVNLCTESSERENELLQRQQNIQQELVETRQTLISLCSELAESVSANAVQPAEVTASEGTTPEVTAPEVTEPSSEPVIPDMTELQQTLTEEIRANNHKREIAELKALIKAQSQLIKNLSLTSAADSTGSTPVEEVPDLTTTIANMQKVKKKGLW
ncbi:hypothetical protein MD588_17945 [Photobacterium sp. SDRW27]|uniref:hypothetical protein n=1 Tax=Photobacterium obscurum TaxID=2829490 RepID=UPI002244A856|nr:hypothetical protein [Photobacterium obscurum]MCW8330676.1 hypothetical protein [Photobacterium obscurum]